jgi:hypothetical protein
VTGIFALIPNKHNQALLQEVTTQIRYQATWMEERPSALGKSNDSFKSISFGG